MPTAQILGLVADRDKLNRLEAFHGLARQVLGSVLLIVGCLCPVDAQNSSSLAATPQATPTAATLSISASQSAVPAATGGYNFTVTGNATMSPLGSAMVTASGNVADVTSLNSTSPIAGTVTFDFGSGNTLTGTFSIPAGIVLPQIGGSTSASGSITISGGTGQYAGATGSFPNVTGTGTATGTFTSTFTAQATGTITIPGNAGPGTMAHFASGAGWTTIITLVNTGTASVSVQVNFYNEGGNAVSLPVVFPQSGSTSSSSLSTVSRTVAAGAELVIQSGGQKDLSVGSIQVVTTGTVSGFVFFRFDSTGQEATVPLETRNPSAFVISFDNTTGLTSGIALCNVSSQPASVKVIIRDDTGANLGSDIISLPGRGHISFVLTDRYGLTGGIRGTLELQTPSNGQISALGLSFNSQGAFTDIPAVAK